MQLNFGSVGRPGPGPSPALNFGEIGKACSRQISMEEGPVGINCGPSGDLFSYSGREYVPGNPWDMNVITPGSPERAEAAEDENSGRVPTGA